jgi:hypothetical protein
MAPKVQEMEVINKCEVTKYFFLQTFGIKGLHGGLLRLDF